MMPDDDYEAPETHDEEGNLLEPDKVFSSTKNQRESSSPSKVSKTPIATALRKAKAEPAPEKEASSEKESSKVAESVKKSVKPVEVTMLGRPVKKLLETEGPGADRRRAIGEGLKSAAKSVGDYFSSLKSPSRMRDEARQKSKTTNMKSGGKVSSASKRADGVAQRGKTRGTMVMCGGGSMKAKR